MAYKYKEPAYYGDMPIAPELQPSMDWHPDHGGGGGGGSGDITEIDFKKVKVYHAPWLEKKRLQVAMDGVTPSQTTTLSGANKRVEEIVQGLKQCATA